MLTTIDVDDTGLSTVIDFEKSCIKAGITLGQSEIQRLVKSFGVHYEDDTFINFKRMSMNLGMHKESYNHLSKSQQNTRKKNTSKLRQMYQSIEEEEEANGTLQHGNALMRSNKNGHKSTLGLRTVETSNDPFLVK